MPSWITNKKAVETVGANAIKLLKRKESINAIDLEESIHKGDNSKKSFEEEVYEALDRGLKDASIEGDFFVIVLFKKERLLQNVVRQYFFYRQSCPTPEFDQTVYHYKRKDNKLEYLWTVPDNVTCMNLPRVEQNLPPEQRVLISMIKSFITGDLDKLAKRLNGEQRNQIIIAK